MFVIERFRIEYGGDSNSIPLIPLLAAVFLALPMLANATYVIVFLRREFKSPEVSTWFFTNSAWGTIVALVAVGNAEVLMLLISQTFGCLKPGSVFNAPFSTKSRERLYLAGAIGNVLEDIPQIFIQAVRYRNIVRGEKVRKHERYDSPDLKV